jgi:hypothetical protein
MLARPSFLADIVIPSASEAISRTISTTLRSAWPGSRVLMNQAFSANRQASRKRGTPWRSQIARTPRRFSRLTGWPPPELLVIVTKTAGTFAGPSSARRVSSLTRSMFPLNGCSTSGWRPSSMTRSTAAAPVNSTFARVVSKWVLLDDCPARRSR